MKQIHRKLTVFVKNVINNMKIMQIIIKLLKKNNLKSKNKKHNK